MVVAIAVTTLCFPLLSFSTFGAGAFIKRFGITSLSLLGLHVIPLLPGALCFLKTLDKLDYKIGLLTNMVKGECN